MNNTSMRVDVLGIGLLALCSVVGCSSGNGSAQPGLRATGTSLYNKYGGLPTIQKIVDDAVSGLIADCVENPYFTNDVINFDNVNADGQGHGTNGHDTVDRLKSCLDAQFTAAFGGPSTYTGGTATSVPSRTIAGQTYDCEDMTTIHGDLGIPPAVFDQFVSDLGSVLAKDGVSNADINTVATGLIGFKPEIVASPNVQMFYDYQPGEPTSPPSVACTIASPIPAPTATPSPTVTPTPQPTASPEPTASMSLSGMARRLAR